MLEHAVQPLELLQLAVHADISNEREGPCHHCLGDAVRPRQGLVVVGLAKGKLAHFRPTESVPPTGASPRRRQPKAQQKADNTQGK